MEEGEHKTKKRSATADPQPPPSAQLPSPAAAAAASMIRDIFDAAHCESQARARRQQVEALQIEAQIKAQARSQALLHVQTEAAVHQALLSRIGESAAMPSQQFPARAELHPAVRGLLSVPQRSPALLSNTQLQRLNQASSLPPAVRALVPPVPEHASPTLSALGQQRINEAAYAAGYKARMLAEVQREQQLQREVAAALITQRSAAAAAGRAAAEKLLLPGSVSSTVAAPAEKLPFPSLSEPSKVSKAPASDLKQTILSPSLPPSEGSQPYRDASLLPDPPPSDDEDFIDPDTVPPQSKALLKQLPPKPQNKGGVSEPFPRKLYRMLTDLELNGQSSVASFFSHGRAFAIHSPRTFVNEIVHRYFKTSSLSSFQRQLNLYNFKRIGGGPDRGGYYHELFLKGRPALCRRMRRTKIKGRGGPGNWKDGDHTVEPNFYEMDPIHIPEEIKEKVSDHSLSDDNKKKSDESAHESTTKSNEVKST